MRFKLLKASGDLVCAVPAGAHEVLRPALAVGMPRARTLPSSDISEDGVLSGDAPAFTFAGVFGGMVIRRSTA